MTFKQYTIVYDILSKIVEEMKQEEKTIKELYNDDYTKYEQDEVYKKLRKKELK